jgi:hypothetical protein
LVGKGFVSVEKSYQNRNPSVNFKIVEQIESLKVPQDESLAFMRAVNLHLPRKDYCHYFYCYPLPLLEIGCFRAAMAPVKSAKRISKEIQKASDPISDVEEYYIGRSVAANIVAKYPVLDNEELTDHVSLVGNTVALNSNMPVTYGGYHFAILDTEEVNAFASPRGIIFLAKGLVDSLENEGSWRRCLRMKLCI